MDVAVNKLVKVNINGKDYELLEGMYLTEAVKPIGIEIPQFCAHRWLEPLGACRMCLVRVEKMPKLQIACALPVREGLVVTTESDEIRRAREEMLEFHLLNHPLECPVCDRGGECPLQDLTERYGKYQSRYIEEKLIRADTKLNPFLRMNYKRCILCKRCVRYCDEIAGDHLIEFEDRGGWTKVTTFLGTESPNRFSGNIIELCPVGAITSIPFRFRGRAWELEKTRTVCNQCSVGCNLELHTRLGSLQRIVPAVNEVLDDGHICDRGRFAYGWVHSDARIRKPSLKDNGGFTEISWSEAESIVAQKIRDTVRDYGGDAIGIIAGNSLTNEDYYALRLFAEHGVGTKNVSFSEDICGLSAEHAQLVNVMLSKVGCVEDIMNSELIVLIGADVLEEAPVLGLRVEEAVRKRGATLASISSYNHDSERYANTLVRIKPGAFIFGESAFSSEEFSKLRYEFENRRRISLIFGQELLCGPSPIKSIKAVYQLAQRIERIRQERQNPLERLTVTPIFRGANSLGALILSLKLGVPNQFESMTNILKKATTGEVKLLYLVGVNPIIEYPNGRLAKEAFSKAEFIVAQDLFLTESSALADIILPVSPWIFRDGTYFNFEGRLQRANSCPLTDVVPSDLELFNRLLISMGKGSQFVLPDELFAKLAREADFIPVKQLADIPKAGILTHFESEAHSFEGIEAISTAEEVCSSNSEPLKEFPFYLVPKHYLFRNSVKVRHTKWMQEVVPKDWAILNYEDAQELGISEGDEVVVESKVGSLYFSAKMSEQVPRKVVIIDRNIQDKAINSLVSKEDVAFSVRIKKA